MNRILILTFLLLHYFCGQTQVIRPFSVRYNNVSERGNIVYVANSIVSSVGGNTSESPPGGSSANNGRVAINIDADGDSSLYFPYGSSWKYLDNNTRPASWETSGYNDAAWATGNAELGYGDGDETTVVSYGPDPNNKYITTYFRKSISLTSLPSSGFLMNIKRDDGVIVYVNGTEVYRSNMPGGAPTHTTLASTAVDGANEYVSASVPSSSFVVGTNVIAVELHQQSVTSSDISFDMELRINTNVVSYGSTWYYHNADTEPASWPNITTLPSGPSAAPLGYGPTSTTKATTVTDRRTYYFLRSVTFDPSVYTSLTFNLNYEDGAVIFVNGVEVGRLNMPAGDPDFTTNSSSCMEPEAIQGFTVGTGAPFVNGLNYIQVEVHTCADNESGTDDLIFDLELKGNFPNATFNSSSGDLNLASCSEVLWAGLYWGTGQGTSGTDSTWITAGYSSVKMKVPGSSVYQTVNASQIDRHSAGYSPGLPHTGYKCFAEITSYLNLTNPNGTYTIADVVSPAGIVNGYGGWCIVVVFANPAEVPRNLTVFDGNVIMNGGDPPVYVPISGFLTPPSGTVSCELGAVVFDGDRVSQDEFSFKQDSNPLVGSYTNLTPNATSNLNDMWNSTISYKGTVVTTRSPAFLNTLGYDADIIDVPNAGNAVLGNNQTSASIRFSSPSENYFIQTVTTAISQFDPVFALDKGSTDLNGGSLLVGEVIRYRINYENVGNDASINTILTDNLPVATGFVPGSLVINGVSKTDASGDDQAEYDFANRRVIFRLGTGANASNGGTLAVGATGYVEFDVYAASSCEILSCGTPTNNIARIDYNGQTSGLALYDSSGYILSGCLTKGPISNVISGTCFVPSDTILVNQCPATSVTLPYQRYAGYSFYSAQPFTAGNAYNPSTPVTQTGTYWAYFNSGGGCHDTIRIQVYINPCPDIDDDDDGLPDYLEANLPLAFGDHDSDGILNYCDAQYPGFVDNNADGINDNFDPSGDSDNDGTPNFLDPDFPGYTDSNSDNVNDNFDWDLDGIPNHLDRDSDNDGIPDVVESFGVDANGDGIIDNFTDTDNDGLSQNVDANNTGPVSSGTGLGALDTDGDGIPNYMDLDSDNDGIPDVIEVYGTDSNNDGLVDGYADMDGDGYSDNVDGDVGNDGVAENNAASLLRTGSDGDNNGRCDAFPNKNMDGDTKPNPYDIDSDRDGITDVIEAGFTDANYDGIIDGPVNAKGWNTAIAALGSLTLPNTDGTGRVNVYDIDSDDDGIPDNVEGMTTNGYLLPANTDTDGDGLDDRYDNIVGFGGIGISPADKDGDTIPDYLDSDTDSDGLADIYEGNDYNLNGLADDNVALTGVDTDGDGLDNAFDTNNSSAEGTSAYMGDGGTFTGDGSPGSNTMVQKTPPAATDRDWRFIDFLLDCDFTVFKAVLQDQNKSVLLDWKVYCRQRIRHFEIERSFDGVNFSVIQSVNALPVLQEITAYNSRDDISTLNVKIIYYRLKAVGESGRKKYSPVVSLKINSGLIREVQVVPNPVKTSLQLNILSEKSTQVVISIFDANGSLMLRNTQILLTGSNGITYSQVGNWHEGTYLLVVNAGDAILSRKFILLKK